MINKFRIRPEFSPLSIVRAIWSRKLQVLAMWILGSAVCGFVVYRLRPIYAATAVILVESQRIPEAFVTATVQTPLEARLDMLKQQVLSRDLLWGLIEDLKLYPRQRQDLTKEELLVLFRDDIKINLMRGWSSRGPGAFEVGYEAPNPATAAEVANRVGMFFINENLRQRTGEAEATSEFLNQQLTEAERRLRENEATLKEFKLSHNGELPQQEAALLAAMGQSKAELLGIQDALGRAQQNKLILEGSTSYAQTMMRERQQSLRRPAPDAHSQPVPTSPPVQPAELTELQRARRELSNLRSRYYDSHPDVVRMESEVQRLERLEATAAAAKPAPHDAPATVPPAATTNAETEAQRAEASLASQEASRIEELQAQIALQASDIQSLERRRERVLAEITDTQNRLRNIPIREQQLAAITRDYDTCKTNYQSLLNKKLASDVAANMERWQKSQKFVMLDMAHVPQKPARPRRLLLIAAGSLLSALFGMVAAFLLELRSNVVLGEWELPTDTVILGRVPKLRVEHF